MTRMERLAEIGSIVMIGLILWYVYQRTGVSMLEAVTSNLPELFERT